MKDQDIEERASELMNNKLQETMENGTATRASAKRILEIFKSGYIQRAKEERERIMKFIRWIDEEEVPYENGFWIQYYDGKDNYLTFKQLFDIFLEKIK